MTYMNTKKKADVNHSIDEQQLQTAGQIYLRLLSYVKPHWFYFSLSILGFIIFAASQPAFAVVMEYLINAIPKNEPMDRWLIPLWLMSIFAVRGLGHFIGSQWRL